MVGVDPDPKALARAKSKAARANISIQLDKGFGDNLPYPKASFDRVLSSFMFHHLPREEKEKMLREVRRVLTSGGEFHMLDFEGPEDAPHGLLTHFRRSRDRLKDNSERRILSLFRQAGFANVTNAGQRAILLGVGRVAYYGASVLNSTLAPALANTTDSPGPKVPSHEHCSLNQGAADAKRGEKSEVLTVGRLVYPFGKPRAKSERKNLQGRAAF